ncbi:MAG TPA: ribosome maturation factor RimM [Stellaceae bacterium]|nr:ribosome maturation factor RimM [Stellaceae bacterium]
MRRVAEKRVCLGVITGVHGVRGVVRVKSFTADPRAIAQYGALSDEKNTRRFELRVVGEVKGVVLVAVTGINDRNEAETLKGIRLYADRDALPPPQPEEFYHADLIGLEAVTRGGEPIGEVRAVHDFGAGDTLEVERREGGAVMVPFTRAVVPEIDIEGGRLVIEPPLGLLDKIEEEAG